MSQGGTDTRGLFAKYRVSRVDGRDKRGGDRERAAYFVMDYAHDPDAWVAVASYAVTCQHRLPALSRDQARELIRTWPILRENPANAAVLDRLLERPAGGPPEDAAVYRIVERIAR